MNQDNLTANILVGAVISYLIGIPIAWGYLYTVLEGAPEYGIAMAAGSLFWPLCLLGKIGVWLAS